MQIITTIPHLSMTLSHSHTSRLILFTPFPRMSAILPQTLIPCMQLSANLSHISLLTPHRDMHCKQSSFAYFEPALMNLCANENGVNISAPVLIILAAGYLISPLRNICRLTFIFKTVTECLQELIY